MNYEVSSEEAGMRLLSFLRKHCCQLSSVKGLKRAVEAKCCKINGRVETFSTFILSKGDRIVFELKEEKKKLLPTLLYEDEELQIYDKPAGVVSLAKNFGNKFLVHRLDKETSGILIVAKTSATLEKMIALFREKSVKKTYFALVDKEVHKKEGKITSFLAKKHSYQGQTIYASFSKGELAITEWRCVEKKRGASLLECNPITGRTHQLRVHLKEMGHPILGDFQYSQHFSCAFHPKRHLLHAFKISFPHPKTEAFFEITAPLPLDFYAGLEFCRMTHAVELFNKKEKDKRRNQSTKDKDIKKIGDFPHL